MCITKKARQRRLIMVFLLLSVSILVFVACGTSGPVVIEKNTVHMSDADFTQSSITISKGGSITLINDSVIAHIIQNGQWKDGVVQKKIESGAPAVNVTFNSNDSHSIGPFNTSGIFNLYCSVHAEMNFTVIAQ